MLDLAPSRPEEEIMESELEELGAIYDKPNHTQTTKPKPNKPFFHSSLSLPSLYSTSCDALGCNLVTSCKGKFPVSNVTLEGGSHIKGTIQDITRTRKRTFIVPNSKW